MSMHLQRQIEKLKSAILALGTLVEEAVAAAAIAIQARDVDLARRVIEQDNEIDRMEIEIEEECLHTLALHQPVAFDLRYIVAVLKINNDLERIADLATNIAEKVEMLVTWDPAADSRFDMLEMTAKVRAMLRQALDALVNIDPVLAERVRSADDEVDQMHRMTYERVEKGVVKSPRLAPMLIVLLGVSRNLERIADHAVNIAEDVFYMARGEILRHSPE